MNENKLIKWMNYWMNENERKNKNELSNINERINMYEWWIDWMKMNEEMNDWMHKVNWIIELKKM